MTTDAINTHAGHIPLARIARIAPVDTDGAQQVEYLDAHGQLAATEAITPLDGTEFLPVMPASPGYELLAFVAEPDADWGFVVERAPILAWRIDGLNAHPVSLDGMARREEAAIRIPTGAVFGPEAGSYACSEELWTQLQAVGAGFKASGDDDP